VKSSRLQLLTTQFENLKMKEDENMKDFHMNILDMATFFHSLGEKMFDKKLVRKILRSLPKRFDMKVTAIEEAQGISNMKVDELIGSLQNFEIVVNNRTEKKGLSIAFASNVDTEEFQEDIEDDESLSGDLVLLGRQFKKILKQVNRRPRSNGKNIRFDISKQQNNLNNTRTDEKNNQSKGVQCRECEGYGNIRLKCATFLKRQKKSLIVSWSDEDDLEREVENESVKRVKAFTGICISDSESCDEELTYEELTASYKDLYTRSTDVCNLLEKQKKTNSELHDERSEHLSKISGLNDEVIQLNSQLEHLKKQIKMMTT